MTTGSWRKGAQGAAKIYGIWDPKTGLHLTTTKTVPTDMFCCAAMIDPITGNMLIAGGDARPQGRVNAGVPDVNGAPCEDIRAPIAERRE